MATVACMDHSLPRRLYGGFLPRDSPTGDACSLRNTVMNRWQAAFTRFRSGGQRISPGPAYCSLLTDLQLLGNFVTVPSVLAAESPHHCDYCGHILVQNVILTCAGKAATAHAATVAISHNCCMWKACSFRLSARDPFARLGFAISWSHDVEYGSFETGELDSLHR